MTLKHQTLLLLLATVAALSAADRKEVDVNADIPWTDSGIDLNAGDSLAFSATGSVAFVGNAASPDGLGRGFLQLLDLPAIADRRLVARVQSIDHLEGAPGRGVVAFVERGQPVGHELRHLGRRCGTDRWRRRLGVKRGGGGEEQREDREEFHGRNLYPPA